MDGVNSKQQISSYIIDSQEEEIKRIALELHEGVGQNLYSILTGLHFIESGLKEEHFKSYLHEMENLIEKTIREIRLLSVELHPPALSDIGLLAAIKNYSKLYTSTFGVVVDIESTGEEKPIPERNRIAVFRVCQEAFMNIAKYADTSSVTMMFNWSEDELNIMIRDFGIGFHMEEKGISHQSSGLAAMKERMLLTGGHCHISSKIGEGTTIDLSLPLNELKES